MKITTSKENFVKEIQTVQSGMNAKSGTLPILQNFLMETAEDGVNISFTDLEMAVRHFITLTVIEPGSVTVPIKKFMEIVTNLGNKEDITISVDDSSRITIQSGRSRIKMGGTKKEEYPALPNVMDGHSFSINALKACDMINSVLFSASTDSDRQFLNGLYWKYANGNFSMVATDGRRLSIKTVSGVQSDKDFGVIVPSKILNELTKYIKSSGLKEEAMMSVNITQNQIGFVLGKTSFVSRLAEGNYPDYEKIIPNEHSMEAKADAETLLAVTKRASICASDRTSKVTYTFRTGSLTVNSSSQNMDFEDEIPVSYEGDEFQVSFNPFFIMEMLKVLPAGEVVMRFRSGTAPALFTIASEEAPLYIIMPVR